MYADPTNSSVYLISIYNIVYSVVVVVVIVIIIIVICVCYC